ncbi:FemAB family XrtA/PEP-CTERM system-associated protein [Thiohalomonas denitrificans]|uniref:FemAB family XrtA/PEP-CTERM system-associated protein n=1 Tax=Thiohalomonas denitrificans TaxID=415747 RepID=UPI0037DDC4F6
MASRKRQSLCKHARDFEEKEVEQWDAFVASHGRGTLYHQLEWGRLIERVFGHQTHYWMHTGDDGELTGVLPLVEIRSRLFGTYQISLPFFNYGGALGTESRIEADLMKQAWTCAKKMGVGHIEFRDTVVRHADYPVRKDKVAMLRELPPDPDQLWRELGGKVRSQVRRPIREGATFVCGGRERIDDFYSVFARNMRDLGTPVYPKRFFVEMLQTFPDRASIGVVHVDKKPVAAAILLLDKETMEIPWASSLREYNRLGVNMLLYWNALSEAISKGARTFDFGRSSYQSGTYRFKRQWGAVAKPLYWSYALPEGGELPDLTPKNGKFKHAIALWKRLPLSVANQLGPRIVKNLP